MASQEDYCRACRWEGRKEGGREGVKGGKGMEGAAEVSEEVGQLGEVEVVGSNVAEGRRVGWQICVGVKIGPQHIFAPDPFI